MISSPHFPFVPQFLALQVKDLVSTFGPVRSVALVPGAGGAQQAVCEYSEAKDADAATSGLNGLPVQAFHNQRLVSVSLHSPLKKMWKVGDNMLSTRRPDTTPNLPPFGLPGMPSMIGMPGGLPLLPVMPPITGRVLVLLNMVPVSELDDDELYAEVTFNC